MTSNANIQSIFAKTYQQPMVTLADLLANYDDGNGNTTPKYFRIPIYQRGYAWGVRQCYELWEDIKRVKENKTNRTSADNVHFVGTLSLKRNDLFDGDYDIINTVVFDVVDGQQRLTTLMIILRLLLNKVNSTNYPISDYIGANPSIRKFQYTLPNIDARDYLEGRLYSLNQNISHNDNAYFTNIQNAIVYFSDNKGYDRNLNEVENPPKKGYPEKHKGCDICGNMSVQDATKYLDVILHKLQFTLNFVDDAHIVFESMNNRGKDPTRLEVLKNRLMCLSPNPNTKNKINVTWGDIYACLGSKSYAILNDDEFLKCHWYMYHGGIVKQSADEYVWQIFDDEFALNRVNDTYIQQKIDTYIDSIKKSITIWRYLNIPDLNSGRHGVPTNLTSNPAAKVIAKLSRLVKENTQSYLKSFILSILCADKLPQDRLEKVLDVTEKCIFIFWNLKHDKNIAFSSKWATLAHEIYELNSISNLPDLIAKVDSIIQDKEDEIKTNLSDALNEFYEIKNKEYGYYGWSGSRYFLFEYDGFIVAQASTSAGAPVPNWYKWNSIEHILPETPYKKTYWQQAFAPYITDADTMRVLIHSLGNFLPLEGNNNSALGNKDYYTKCTDASNHFAYVNGCASARQVANKYPKYWTATEIYSRIDDMALFLFNTWIKSYASAAGLTISEKDIADKLKLDNPATSVPQQTDPVIMANLDQEIAQTVAQKQAHATATPKNRKNRNQKNTVISGKYASVCAQLEVIFKQQGYIVDSTGSYFRIYKPDWHKIGRNIHYQIWGKSFALMCEKSTTESIVQKLAADTTIKPILNDHYTETYSVKYAENKIDLTDSTRFHDDNAIVTYIKNIIDNTHAIVDLCL